MHTTRHIAVTPKKNVPTPFTPKDQRSMDPLMTLVWLLTTAMLGLEQQGGYAKTKAKMKCNFLKTYKLEGGKKAKYD